MKNTEILKNIEKVQYAIDMLIVQNTVKFKSADDIKILEKIYNEITGRKYVKFDSGCSSCIKEALIISENYRKRELKNYKTEVTEVNEIEEVTEVNEIEEVTEVNEIEEVTEDEIKKQKVAERMQKVRAGRKKKNE